MKKQLSFFPELGSTQVPKPDKPRPNKPEPNSSKPTPTAPEWTKDELRLRRMMDQGLAVVVNVRKRGPHQLLVPWAKEQGLFTYIGRRNKWTGHEQSIFHNPYWVGDGNPRCPCVRYKELLERSPRLLSRLPDLRGHALGCWCAPNPCHGYPLADSVNEHLKAA